MITVDSFLQVTALDLIKHEEFSQLSLLLRKEFRPLARLLLLLGWTQCRSLDSARTLLSILHLEQVSYSSLSSQDEPSCMTVTHINGVFFFLSVKAPANDGVLQEFAALLSSQLLILEWCKNNNL